MQLFYLTTLLNIVEFFRVCEILSSASYFSCNLKLFLCYFYFLFIIYAVDKYLNLIEVTNFCFSNKCEENCKTVNFTTLIKQLSNILC